MSPQFNLKIYCVDHAWEYASWMRGTTTQSIETADVVVFPGGVDVDPALYGDFKHPLTLINPETDKRHVDAFHKAQKLEKKCIGICRGAQFLCAMAGGRLVQHQANGHNRHAMLTYDGERISVSSDHHQAMFPWEMRDIDYKVLGWSVGLSTYHEDSDRKEMVVGTAPLNMEVEMAYFHGINALGIQGHPEWQYKNRIVDDGDQQAINYFRKMMDRFLGGDKFENAHNAFAT